MQFQPPLSFFNLVGIPAEPIRRAFLPLQADYHEPYPFMATSLQQYYN